MLEDENEGEQCFCPLRFSVDLGVEDIFPLISFPFDLLCVTFFCFR